MKRLSYIFSLFVSFISYSQEIVKLSIDEAYNFAKENNVNIKTAKLDVINSENKIKETRAIGLPQINGNVGYNYYINQPVSLLPAQILGGKAGEYAEVVFGTKQNMSAGASLNQILFNGSYLVGLQSAKAYKKITELALEKTDVSIKEAVFLTYSSIVATNENLEIIDKNIQITKKNRHDVGEIFKVGLGEEQPVDQMEYNLVSLTSSKKNLERTRNNLINGLKFLIGKKSEEKIELTTSLDELLKIQEKLVDETSFSSWDNHIDVKIAENNKLIKELQLKYERSKALPSVNFSLNSAYNSYSNEFSFYKEKWFNTTIAGLGINIPIFSGFDRKYKAQQAKIEIEKANILLDNTKEELTKKAKEQYNLYQSALEQLDLSKKLQKLASKIFKTQQTKYYEGIGTSFDLINAENQKNQADNNYIQAIFDVIQNKIKLEKILNTL